MGCDIHLVLEQRSGDKWVGINTFAGHHRGAWLVKEGDFDWSSSVARSRNYRRFAALAGVRGDGPSPRGLPVDASDTTILLTAQWGRDGHSHSWLPLKEAAAIWKETGGILDKFADEHPESYFFEASFEPGTMDDFRVVFWFDN
jgi:hypothetical protein